MLDLSTEPAAPRGPAADPPRGLPWRVLVPVCMVVSALSLLGPHALTYDPTAWLIWGREVVDGDLETRFGPSWKPLPLLFTTPFSLLGHDVAPLLWLVISRTGGLMAVILAFRLARRMAGPVAGGIAAAGLLLSDAFISFALRGQSEGMLAAVTLGAVERHLDDRRGQAFALAVAAALLRPEVWPLVGLYGLWLIRARPAGTSPWPVAAAVGVSGVAIIALWVIPERIGSGDLLRAASRARIPVEGMPGEAAIPFLAVFTNAAGVIWWPLYVGAAVAVWLAWRGRGREADSGLVLVLAAIAAFVALLVALLTQTVGFTGTARYLIVPVAMLCVLGGVGLVRGARLVRERLSPGRARAALAAALVVAVPFAVVEMLAVDGSWRAVTAEARDNGALPGLIERAGGREAVVACGLAFTRGFQTQVIAYELGTHESGVSLDPEPPGTIIALEGEEMLEDDRFPYRVANADWTLASSCPLPGTTR